jgi:hypothetical protein
VLFEIIDTINIELLIIDIFKLLTDISNIYVSNEVLIELKALEFFIDLKHTLIDPLNLDKQSYIEPIKEVWITKNISIEKVLDLVKKI